MAIACPLAFELSRNKVEKVKLASCLKFIDFSAFLLKFCGAIVVMRILSVTMPGAKLVTPYFIHRRC
jgi:hypothetical protein